MYLVWLFDGGVLNRPKPFFNFHHYAAHGGKPSMVLPAENQAFRHGASRKGTA
jgi:hypothetical protein